MRDNSWKYSILSSIFFMGITCLFPACNSKNSFAGKVIFTRLPVQVVSDEQLEKMDWKYAPELKIMAVSMESEMEDFEELTTDFYSARASEIAYDGKSMVFSGQKNQQDTWQIWKFNFEKREFTQVSHSEENCTDPTWLPDGGIAFSKLITEENGLQHHALFTIGQDGCCEQRISFQPHEDVNTSVLHDGRLLFASRQAYPEPGLLKYLAMRPDGTKAELFYLPQENTASLSKANENENGLVLFTQSGKLSTIKFSRPLHSSKDIASAGIGTVLAVIPIDQDRILISSRNPTERSFGLYLYSVSEDIKKNVYVNKADFHAIEPGLVSARAVPRKLPSRVNLEMESGYLFCMNSDNSDIAVESRQGQTSKIQVLGVDMVLGETTVEPDGSFYLELTADQPVRFQTLSESGDILRGPSSWMWVRPNERRGCVGCHANREIAPENVVPKAIEKSPVSMFK